MLIEFKEALAKFNEIDKALDAQFDVAFDLLVKVIAEEVLPKTNIVSAYLDGEIIWILHENIHDFFDVIKKFSSIVFKIDGYNCKLDPIFYDFCVVKKEDAKKFNTDNKTCIYTKK